MKLHVAKERIKRLNKRKGELKHKRKGKNKLVKMKIRKGKDLNERLCPGKREMFMLGNWNVPDGFSHPL